LPPVCGGNYVDAGGLTGNYANNTTAATGTQYIAPTPGNVVTVTFTSFNTQLDTDLMKVYNGNNTLATSLIGTFSGTTLPPVFTSSAPDGGLTFVFTSNATTVASGWVANVTCAPPPTCQEPIALATTNILANSVELSWTNAGPSTTWQVIALPCTDPAPTASTTGWITANTNPFTVPDLDPTTCYKLYVRTDCSATAGGVSPWSLPTSITTPCSYYNVPFQEGFNSASTSEQCWKVINGNTDADQWNMNYATTPFEGDQVASITTDLNGTTPTSNNDWLISPQIMLTGNQRLRFTYKVDSAADPNQFKVLLSTVNNPTQADFTQTLIPTTTYSNTGYVERKVNLSAYTGLVYIAWQVPPSTATDGTRIYIDNVIVENLPVCAEPDVVVASSVTSSSVHLEWINGNTETAWEVLAQPCSTAAPTASTTGYVPAGTNPFTLPGLDPNTCYDIYVRAVCSPTDKSVWTPATSIRTLCVPFNVPFVEGFNSTSATQSCWTVLNVNNDADSWDMDYTTNPYEGNQVASILTNGNNGNNNDWLISPQVILTGNQRLRYRYRVENSGEPNQFRVMLAINMTSTADFTTTVVPLASYNNATYVQNTVNLTNISGIANIGFHIPTGTVDGNRLYIDRVVIEDIPTCLPPINLTVGSIEATSAVIEWTDTNTPTPATQWEVIFVPQGDPEPLPTDTGEIVSFNPATMTGLLPGTPYTCYVRAVCSTTDKSEWSLGINFTTLIINDNCIGAIFAPVNQTQLCDQVTPGTINGATASSGAGIPAACHAGAADDDVWYTFVASNPYLTIQLVNIVGNNNLNFAVYSGTCSGLTQKYCSTAATTSGTVNGLTIGQIYYIRIYSSGTTPQTTTFDLCITTPSSCLTGTSACQDLQYQNTTSVASQGTIGCLNTSPNPTYYTINVSETGPISLLLTQSTTAGGAPNLDVDYAAWGPFTDQATACAAIGNPPTLAPGIGVPVSQTTGCSFSPNSTETLNIANATAGQVYVILITNYSDDPGYISLDQQNSTTPGAGTYACCPRADILYTPYEYCKLPSAANPVAIIKPGSLAGTFSLAAASPSTGLVFANTATGEIDLAATPAGIYMIQNTLAANPTTGCSQIAGYYTVSIVEPTSAVISYPGTQTYCQGNTTLQPVTVVGTQGGYFAVSPNGGLSINTTNGTINPALSNPGTYTITYGLTGGTCTLGNPSTTVTILAQPAIPNQSNITKCDTYTLPALPVGDYYSQSQLTGPATTPLDITIPITTTQTFYAYAMGGNGCPTEKSFTVTINKVPDVHATVMQQPTCAVQTGIVKVDQPTTTSGGVAGNLFISEVTDSDALSLTYVELYNATGAAINLSGYRLKFYTTVTGPPSCDLLLSGTIANNATFVVKVSANANAFYTNGVQIVPNLTFAGCGGVNWNDNIRLTTSAGVEIDLWGPTDGSTFTPLGQPGFDYRRKTTAPHPSLTWDPNDWTIFDWTATVFNYDDVNSYSYLISNYTYSIDNGAFQSSDIFTGVLPGGHTIIVHDAITGCDSPPYPITLDLIGATNPDTNFGYPSATVCKLDPTNPLPTNPAPVSTGGTYGVYPTTTTGLAINGTTGEIDLANTTPGTYTIRYEVLPDLTNCVNGGHTDTTITIQDSVSPTLTFSYTSPICKIAQATLPLSTVPAVSGGQYSGSAGLVIDANTGVIDLVLTPAGTYDVYYAVPDKFDAALGICQKATTSLAVQVIITPATPANVIIDYFPTSVCKLEYTTLPLSVVAPQAGGTYVVTPSTGLVINQTTGTIDVTNSTSGTYSIVYTVGDITNNGNCISGATSAAVTVTIKTTTTANVAFHYDSPVCAGSLLNPMPIPDNALLFTTGGTYSSTNLTVDPLTGEIDLSTTVPGQSYTVKYTVQDDFTLCLDGAEHTANIETFDPIPVEITNECVNNDFTLTANPVNNSFVPTAVTYEWKDASGAVVGTTQTLVITTPGLYTVTVNSAGCIGFDSNTYPDILCNIQIQKGISVNNDLKNDFFNLTGLGVKKLTIFNRYGMKVYSKTNYVKEWGGQSDKGDELPDGTYYYVIERNNGETITNWIYINRAQ
jgi:gliding motility-associated-like protein